MVDPAAITAAKRILGQMLRGREDIPTRLVEHHAALAIIPKACTSDPFGAESVTHHEFAHAIMNLAFTQHDRDTWSGIFRAAVAKHLFPGAFAMTSADEYWAELTQSYFSVNDEINTPSVVRAQDPAAAAFLAAIYGPAPNER